MLAGPPAHKRHITPFYLGSRIFSPGTGKSPVLPSRPEQYVGAFPNKQRESCIMQDPRERRTLPREYETARRATFPALCRELRLSTNPEFRSVNVEVRFSFFKTRVSVERMSIVD